MRRPDPQGHSPVFLVFRMVPPNVGAENATPVVRPTSSITHRVRGTAVKNAVMAIVNASAHAHATVGSILGMFVLAWSTRLAKLAAIVLPLLWTPCVATYTV